MRKAIAGGTLITPLEIYEDADVLIEDGTIVAIGPGVASGEIAETIETCVAAEDTVVLRLRRPD